MENTHTDKAQSKQNSFVFMTHDQYCFIEIERALFSLVIVKQSLDNNIKIMSNIIYLC